MKAKPIVKWAGGKRQIIDKLREYMPNHYNRYFEPFVGGGALLFDLMPKRAVINDINSELLLIYKCLANCDYFNLLIEELNYHEKHHSENYYYQVREEDRKPEFALNPIWKRAARVIYLNKSCFNGLYRVNSKGYFNVPFGKKNKVATYDLANMKKLNQYFVNSDISILEGDFVDAVSDAIKRDFVYFDPPYDSYKGKESFTSYTKSNFTKQDQIRLYNTFKDLSYRGAYVMLSNHNTSFINELYANYNKKIIKAKRMINSDSKGRGFVEETIITNY